MGKKILLLSASPLRGGNSDLLCDEFMRGAAKTGNKCEKIFLRDKRIGECSGCGACRERGEGCPQEDDMAGILDKMLAAQVLVMATPVSFYTMDAQMKTLLDRSCSHYAEISSKDFYFIITGTDSGRQAMERTLAGFRGFMDSCLMNPIEKGVIFGFGTWKKGDIKGNPALNQAYGMGRRV